MKALTLLRPWGWTFFYPPEPHRKHLENRVWKPPQALLGQRVALHSGKGIDRERLDYIVRSIPGCQALPDWPRAFEEGIIGTVKINGWLHNDGMFPTSWPADLAIPKDQDKWFFGPYASVCSDEKVLATPIPCKGALGFWDLPADIEKALKEQGAA